MSDQQTGAKPSAEGRGTNTKSVPLPSIQVTGRHARDIIDEAAEALFAANDRDPQLYAQKRRIYRKKRGAFFPAEWVDLRSVLGRSVNFFKTREDGTDCPTNLPDGHISLLKAHLLDNIQRFPRLPEGVVIGALPEPVPSQDEEEETL